jgi:hypothetical protein
MGRHAPLQSVLGEIPAAQKSRQGRWRLFRDAFAYKTVSSTAILPPPAASETGSTKNRTGGKRAWALLIPHGTSYANPIGGIFFFGRRPAHVIRHDAAA